MRLARRVVVVATCDDPPSPPLGPYNNTKSSIAFMLRGAAELDGVGVFYLLTYGAGRRPERQHAERRALPHNLGSRTGRGHEVLYVEYHTLYGVDRTRLTTRLPVTVLGKDSQYGRIVCGMCCEMTDEWPGAVLTASVNSAVVHCTLQGFIARLFVRADKGRRAVWNYRVHDVYNATHDCEYAQPGQRTFDL